MIPEDRAAIAVWKILSHSSSIEWFKWQLKRQSHPEWNQAVGIVADAIREAVREARVPTDEWLAEMTRMLEAARLLPYPGDTPPGACSKYDLDADLAREAQWEKAVSDTPDWVDAHDREGGHL